jgi:glycosyltransferase involved in cell wall biosynthesis
MNVVMFTPMPPTRTGVAHYSSILAPALREKVDLQVISSPDELRRQPATGNRQPIYHLGNNPHHEWIYDEAMRAPGVIVLHDYVLHHLIVEMTLARGDVEGYVAALEANHGAAGAAWARGRAVGLHSEIGNFLLPASVVVANRSRAVIVHNQYAADRLQSFGVKTPIHVIGHPYVHDAVRHDRDGLRRRLGFGAPERVIGFFGFLTSAKRAEVILEAFARARQRDAGLRLLVVGEPAPNIDVAALQRDGVVFTGYVPDEDFASYYEVADRFVNLRYPSAGETSGTLIRALDSGKPVAVSEYAQFAELPDSCVVKIPFGEEEVSALAEFFVAAIASPAAAQREWLEANARVDRVAGAYVGVLSGAPAPSPVQRRPGAGAPLVLFPAVSASYDGSAFVFRNEGNAGIRTHAYGEPGYRVIVKLFADGVEVRNRWIELPRDLAPGETARVSIDTAHATRATLHHALQGIPVVDRKPFAELML